MDDDHSQLMQNLIASNREMSRLMYQVHGNVARIHERQEHLIQANARFVNTTEERAEDHSKRIDDTASKVAAWEAQLKLVVAVATFLGGSGIFAIIAVLFKVYSK